MPDEAPEAPTGAGAEKAEVPKVFGIGLNKTGTKTLGECLRVLGRDVLNRSSWVAYDLWAAHGPRALLPIVASHDAFEDWPWALCYPFLDKAFPGSKFVLTTRLTPEAWFESLCRHAERTGPTQVRKRIYGHSMPHQFARDHISYYERHNREVREYFSARPSDLIEICWERGDGWTQLAPFLGAPVPEVAVPHLNARPKASSPRPVVA